MSEQPPNHDKSLPASFERDLINLSPEQIQYLVDLNNSAIAFYEEKVESFIPGVEADVIQLNSALCQEIRQKLDAFCYRVETVLVTASEEGLESAEKVILKIEQEHQDFKVACVSFRTNFKLVIPTKLESVKVSPELKEDKVLAPDVDFNSTPLERARVLPIEVTQEVRDVTEEGEEVLDEAGSEEQTRLGELFVRLQAGESEAIGEGALLGNVQSLKDDLSKILISAGYSSEHDYIFAKVLSPIFDKVVLARKEEPNNHIKRNKLRKSLIETVSQILKECVFSEATSEGRLDIEREEVREKFEKLKTKYDSYLEIVDSNPHTKAIIFHLGTDAVEKSIGELEAFLNSAEVLTQKEVNRANLNIARLTIFNNDVENLLRPADMPLDTPQQGDVDPALKVDIDPADVAREALAALEREFASASAIFTSHNNKFCNGLYNIGLRKFIYPDYLHGFLEKHARAENLLLKYTSDTSIHNPEALRDLVQELKDFNQLAEKLFETLRKRGADPDTLLQLDIVPPAPDPIPNPADGLDPVPPAPPVPSPAPAPVPPPAMGREVTGPNARKEYDWTNQATDAETINNALENLRMIVGRQGAESSDENVAKIKQALSAINDSEKKVSVGLSTPEELQKIKNESLNSLLDTVETEALNNLISSEIIITSKTEAKDILAPRSKDETDYESAKTKLSAVRDGKEVTKTDGTTEKVGGFKAEKRAYMEALRKHHEEQGIISGAKNSLSKFFRGKELELPPEVLKLQTSYREKRAAYAEALKVALEERGQSRIENKDFSLDTPEAKRAFAGKFILNPRQEAMDLKQEVTLSKEQASKVSGLMIKMRENPRATRALGLLAAASAGAFTGGLAGGGLAITRFLLSTTVGVALAAGAFNAAQGSVDRAMKNSETVAASTLTNFTLADLNLLEEQLLEADTAGEVAKTKQKSYAVGTAVAFGGATGLGTSALLSMPDATEAASVARLRAPNPFQPEVATPLAAPSAAASSLEQMTVVDGPDPAALTGSGGNVSGAQAEVAPTPASSGIKAEIYQVKPNDILSTILHKSLLTQFDQGTLPAGMERAELSNLMYEKFPEMTSAENPKWTLTPDQWKELGVKSGNPGMVRAGETIDVEALMKMVADKELKPGAAGTMSLDHPISRPSTGPLSVKDVNNFEQLIKIKHELPWSPSDGPVRYDYITDTSPAPRGTLDPMNILRSSLPENLTPFERFKAIELNRVNLSQNELLAAHELTKPPTFSGDSGNFESNEYKTYLAQNGIDSAEKIISKAAANFEGKTYNWFNEIAQTFNSPYTELSQLSVKEMSEIKQIAGKNDTVLRTLLEEKAEAVTGKPVTFNLPTVKAWTQWLDTVQAQKGVPYTDTTTIADLFSRSTMQQTIQSNFDLKYAAKLK